MGRVVVVGIDPSSRKIAMVLSDIEGTWVEKRVVLMPAKKPDLACWYAFRFVRKVLKDLIERGYHPRVFIERAVGAPAGGIGSMVPQVEASGAVHAACGSLNVPIVKAQIGSWKKQVVGNGAAKKPEVAAWAKKYWHQLYVEADGDQDVIDAGAINRFGAKNINTAIKMKVVKPQSRPKRKRK